MIDSPSYRMAERLAGGDLVAILRQLRTERNLSFVRIARELWKLHGIDVSAMTVKNWCDTLDISPAEPEHKAG